MSKLEELLEGCPTTVIDDLTVADALAEEMAEKYLPANIDYKSMARDHINQFLVQNTTLCLSRDTLSDKAVIEIILAGAAHFKGWVKR